MAKKQKKEESESKSERNGILKKRFKAKLGHKKTVSKNNFSYKEKDTPDSGNTSFHSNEKVDSSNIEDIAVESNAPSKKSLEVIKAKKNKVKSLKFENNTPEPKSSHLPTGVKREKKKNRTRQNSLDTTAENETEKSGLDQRTIFIGNLAHTFKKKKLLQLLNKFGKVENVWTRGAIPWISKSNKKVAIQQRERNNLPEDHPPLIAYARFDSVDGAKNALNLNGQLFLDCRLRITLSKDHKAKVDQGVFIGNLPFNIKEDKLYEVFQECGEILGVRIIRDSTTGLGKGFGYVNFKSADSVELAMQLDGSNFEGREIRVKRLMNERKKKKVDKINVRKKSSSSTSSQKLEGPITRKILFDKDKKPIKKRNANEKRKKELAKKLTRNNKLSAPATKL